MEGMNKVIQIGFLLAVAACVQAQTVSQPGGATVSSPSTNGAAYWNGSLLTTTATGGAGTLCLTSTNGGAPVYGACSGTASTVWSALTNPVANLSLAMGANLTTFTGSAATGAAANLFTFTDTLNNTGTGSIINVNTASGSAAFPLTVTARGTANGVQMSVAGSLGAIGTGAIVATSAPIAGVTGMGTNCGTFLTTPSSANLAACLTDETGTGSAVFGTSPTIVTPTIASFVNATHNHQNAAGGGTLAEAALALTNITTNNATTSAHGFLPILPGTTTTFLNGNGAYTAPFTLTTTGSSGAATFSAGTLNIPNYVGGTGCVPAGTIGVVQASNGAGACQATAVTDNGTTVASTEPITAPSVATGTSPPSVTVGTGGVIAGAEGTNPASGPAASVDVCVFNSTQHGIVCSFNNGSYAPIPQGPTSTTSGHVVTWNATNGGLLADLATTGSGNAVLATSPTLVTPNLGTPSAAVLTNATGLPLSGLATQAADTVVMNATGSTAAPTAVAMPTGGTNGCAGASNALTYNTTTHALGCNSITAGGATLSSLTAATGANTLANGDNAQIWNWALTTASKSAFTFGETTAATSTGTPFLMNIQTLSTSTANPLQVTAGGTTNGIRVNTSGILVPVGTGGVAAGATPHGVLISEGNAALAVATSAGSAGQVLKYAGSSADPAPSDVYDVKIIPASTCVSGTAGAGWSTATFTAACRAGTNNIGGALQGTPSGGAAGQFLIELPANWDTSVQPWINIFYGSGANTTGTVIWTVSSACSKADGSVSDDPTLNAETAFATQTMAAANRMWSQSGQFTAITSGNNCIPGGSVIIKMAVSGTASSAINAYQAVVTIPRTLAAAAQ